MYCRIHPSTENVESGIVATSGFARKSCHLKHGPDDGFWVVEIFYCGGDFKSFANPKNFKGFEDSVNFANSNDIGKVDT